MFLLDEMEDFNENYSIYTENQLLIHENCFLLNEAVKLPKDFVKFCNENSAMKVYNEFNKNLLKFIMGRPQQIVVSNEVHLIQMKKKLKSVTNEKEKQALINRLEKDLNGYKRNKNYWINKSNIIPGVDKQIKSKSIDRAIRITEELLKELK